jgi:hypothetical protein
MVVHPDFQCLEVEIVTGDRDELFREYREVCQSAESGTPVRFVEAISEVSFVVRLRFPLSCFTRYAVQIDLIIDGNNCSKLSRTRENILGGEVKCVVRGRRCERDDKSVLQNFRFQKLRGKTQSACRFCVSSILTILKATICRRRTMVQSGTSIP